ncbi:MAG TPA: TonB-dependent receptor [Rhodanobacter sp.]|nr:TonB-dependent receptor [Rhodanobacter sp.]
MPPTSSPWRHGGVTVATTVALLLVLVQRGVALADPPVQQLHEVNVIAVAPLAGFDVPVLQIPLNVQSAQADDIRQTHGQSMTELLQRNFQGVSMTQSQGNPWQGNLYFHGFVLSPLLGSPAGISVYMDGVRQNEPFAETMNWEAIPDFAIRDVELVPGSNPLYGLNTLAGALLLTSKSGFTDPGGSLNLSGGSWGRIQMDADIGAHSRRFGIYIGAGSDFESGWRDYSSSRVQQAFVRGDWHPDEDTVVTLSYTGAHGRLSGTQSLPVEWVRTPQAGYTWPDHFNDNINTFNLQGSRQLGSDWSVQANAYLRISQSRSFNSNTNNFSRYDAGADGPLGYAANGPYNPDSIGQFYYSGLVPAFDASQPAATINNVPASNVLGNVHTRGYGGSIQAVDNGSLWGRDNQFTIGLSLDTGESAFSQYVQPAYFPSSVARRGDAVGLLPFGPDPVTDAGTSNRSEGVYLMDVLTLPRGVHFSVGGRYNYSRLTVADRTGGAPTIDGRQTFHRFDPSIGATWAIGPQLGAYLNYDEGMRTPTPIEFECADPAAPCSLPNDFSGDPPLHPVVVRTLAGGLRGTFAGGNLRWNVSPYDSRVSNDILTIYTGGSSQGYFANVPRTGRRGVDIGLGGQHGRLEWQANYSHVSATYGVAFDMQSAANSSADANGVIHIRRGDRIPGVPHDLFNFSSEYRLTDRWSFGGNVRAYSGQYAVGDENNRDRHGMLPGYAVVALDLHYRPTRRLAFFARIDNAFDRRYDNGGLLSDNVFDTPNRLVDLTGPGTPTLFVAPGTPRAYLVGLSYSFGGAGGDH